MTPATVDLTLDLVPLDVLFFRDGRALEAGSRAASGLPAPQTLSGAIRSKLLTEAGCNFDRLGADMREGVSFREALHRQDSVMTAVADLCLRGPWLAEADTVYVATPSILRREKTGSALVRLAPLADPLPGWPPVRGTNTAWPLWARTSRQLEVVGGCLPLDAMKAVLEGGVPAATDVRTISDLVVSEERTGIAIEPGGTTVAESMIFSVGFLRLQAGVSFRCELVGVAPHLVDLLQAEGALRWGGEGRYVRYSTTPDRIPWPTVEPSAGAAGMFVVLTTPALLDNGWTMSAWQPAAASVGSPVPISGWDMARGGPKPTRYAVPPGSTFFFAGDAPGPTEPFVGTIEDGRLGYGCFLKGYWTHA